MEKISNYINGSFCEPNSGNYIDSFEPATGKVYALIPDSDSEDVDKAVKAAKKAFPLWSTSSAKERSDVLMYIADLIEKNLDELAQAESKDNGKPVSLARSVDIPRAASNFRFFATAILHQKSELHTTDNTALNYTLRRPVGVVGLISPWNLPLYLFTWKAAPALAFGCTAVAKPSEVTPMTAYMLSDICKEAGLPNGALNIVHGQGGKVGASIVEHADVKAISFTGGTVTGAAIARSGAPQFKKLSLELGGKNPNIVFADADLNKVVQTTVRSSFANQGQICLCGSRILVERSIHDQFVEQLVSRANSLVVGDPEVNETDQGALVSRSHMEKVLSYIELAKVEGGKIECGGERVTDLPDRCREGYFVTPTIITGLDQNCRVNQEEIFGPVVSVIPFDSDEHAIEIANSTEYGLAASIWTNDLDRAHYVADQIEFGTVWINCWMLRDLRVPFGGMKASGVGREGGDEAYRFFTEPKNVCLQLKTSERKR